MIAHKEPSLHLKRKVSQPQVHELEYAPAARAASPGPAALEGESLPSSIRLTARRSEAMVNRWVGREEWWRWRMEGYRRGGQSVASTVE